MPNRFQKAVRAFKDQTSISLAMVNGSSNIQLAILKATSHDDLPIDEIYVQEILQLISSDKAYASTCAKAVKRRITRTRNWMVALKSLMLVLRIFQDGDLYFPREVLHATKKGERILNLSGFIDYSSSTPEDYTGFVKTYGLYLEERLNCILSGKLQRRYRYHEKEGSKRFRKRTNDHIREMKPAVLIDRIVYWQRLLEKAIATMPAGVVKDNQLVKISVYAVVRESFDLYRDISDGLGYLLDNFLKLEYESWVRISEICVESEKQFEELDGFYSVCKTIGVGSGLEYPTVERVSREQVERLQEFLKDDAILAEGGLLSEENESYREESEFLKDKPVLKEGGLLSKENESDGENSEFLKDKTVLTKEDEEESEFSKDKIDLLESGLLSEKVSDKTSESGSVEKLKKEIEMGKSPSLSNDLEASYTGEAEKSNPQEPFIDLISSNNKQKEIQQETKEEYNKLSESSSEIYQCEPTSRKDWELVLAEIVPPSPHANSNSFGTSANSQEKGFEAFLEHEESGLSELVLAQTPTCKKPTQNTDILSNTFHAFTAITLHNLQSKSQPINHYNSFLQDLYDIPDNNSCIASYWAQNQIKATNEQFTIKTT